MTEVQRLVENSSAILSFLNDFSSGDPADISIDVINEEGEIETRTFANLAKMQEGLGEGGSSGKIKQIVSIVDDAYGTISSTDPSTIDGLTLSITVSEGSSVLIMGSFALSKQNYYTGYFRIDRDDEKVFPASEGNGFVIRNGDLNDDDAWAAVSPITVNALDKDLAEGTYEYKVKAQTDDSDYPVAYNRIGVSDDTKFRMSSSLILIEVGGDS